MKSTYVSSEQMTKLRRDGFMPEISPSADVRPQEGFELIRFIEKHRLEFAVVPKSALRACTGRTSSLPERE